MKLCAVIGPIASGKTELMSYLAKKYPVFNLDTIFNDLLTTKGVVAHNMKNEVLVLFPQIMTQNQYDKDKMRKLFFEDLKLLESFEKCVYPFVWEKLIEELNKIKGKQWVFIEGVKLYKEEFRSKFDKYLAITAPKEIRKTRVLNRDSYMTEELFEKIENSISWGTVLKACDYTLINDSDLESLHVQTNKFLDTI